MHAAASSSSAEASEVKRRRTSCGHRIKVVKTAGKVSTLSTACERDSETSGTLGIAHTRWATHGPPNDVNAHPHLSTDGSLAVVHNGIIENFRALRSELIRKGYTMRSETDTELIAHLISDIRSKQWMPLEEAVRQALSQVQGAFGIAVLAADEPHKLVGARKGSPLILGIGDDEYLLASDASAVIERTRRVAYLNDGELVCITRDAGYQIKTLENVKLIREVQELQMSLHEIQKGSFKHFMLKEIAEQPEVLENAMRGRLLAENDCDVNLGGLMAVMPRLVAASRILIVACGTSWHAGLLGEYLIETLARVPVEVEYASEFRYRRPLLFEEDVVIAISQSGETADTIAALHLAKQHGCLCLGVCNTVGSSIARATDAGVYLHAGPEIGVASTKAFSAQILVLTLIAIKLGKERKALDTEQVRAKVRAMMALPDLLRRVLEQKETVLHMARVFKYASNFLYLGRGFNFPVALEGALKLKEISYIHAEGYPAAEMKHGPIALIDEFMPVVIIAPRSDPNYSKLQSNIEEVLARGGSVIAITEEDNDELDSRCEYVIKVPRTEEFLMPLLAVAPLQLMAYYIADMRKCNVDQPRNLAKSVTVE
uniref:glutamine--fructose-6-phosphate transaminase (isomerizing) n=1 Tax=Calcidiscus leptoporus TaxID=127549 RepID=A0A7S0P2V0_9EUKA